MDRYEPRLFKSYDPVRMSGTRIKPYTIAAPGREDIDLQPVLDRAAVALAASSLMSMPHRGLGYLILHAGEEANWLLTRVWMKGGIVSGLLARFDGGEITDVHDPLVECVWEEVVAHYERQAWVRHMMTDAEDTAGYLGDRLTGGMH